MSCTRDLLLTFPRLRHPSTGAHNAQEAKQCFTRSCCTGHQRKDAPGTNLMLPIYPREVGVKKRSKDDSSNSRNTTRTGHDCELQPENVWESMATVTRSAEAPEPAGKIARAEANTGRSLSGKKSSNISSASVPLLTSMTESGTQMVSVTRIEYGSIGSARSAPQTKNSHDPRSTGDQAESSGSERFKPRNSVKRWLKERPDMTQALQDRRFRRVIFEIMREPELRRDEELLGHVRTTMLGHARRKDAVRVPVAQLRKRPSLQELGLTDMAARLGMPPAGYMRGEAWEQLHRLYVWERGQLPPSGKVLEAIHKDIRRRRMRRVGDAEQSAGEISGLEEKGSGSEPSGQRQMTRLVNGKLSALLRSGSMLAAGRRIRKGRPSDQDGTASSSRNRPSSSGRQISRLFAIIHQHKQRGFRPDRVTANIALKCWFRNLDTPVRSLPRTKDGVASNGQIARSLSAVLDYAALDRLLVDRPQESSCRPTKSPSHMPSAHTQQLPSYDRHVKRLGRLLVRASRSRGDWLTTRRILTRLAILRSHEKSRRAESPL